MSSFDFHPILDAGQTPRPGVWYAISPEGESEAPCARVGACASFLPGENGGRVLLTCGASPEGPFSDVYHLSLSTGSFSWCKATSTGLPPRYEHAAFAVGDDVYVFAGAQENGPMNDLWKYDQASGCWGSLSPQGDSPPPRTLHCTTSAKDTSLLVFSGGTSGTTPTVDQNVYCLNTAPLEWSCLTTSGAAPAPRQGHILAVVGSKLFVHGGMAGQEIFSDLHTLDLDTWSWSQPVVDGTPPPPLAAHSCAVVGRRVYLFGGLTIGGASDALYCLDTDVMKWEKVPISGPPPPARLDHAMCTVLISGGCEQQCSAISKNDTSTTVPQKDDGGGVPQKDDGGGVPQKDNGGGVPQKDDGGGVPQKDDGGGVSQKDDGGSVPQKDGTFVTVISPDNISSEDVGVYATDSGGTLATCGTTCTSARPEKPDSSQDVGSHQAILVPTDTFVPALFVFGGMDTCGTIHSDCFVFVPPQSL